MGFDQSECMQGPVYIINFKFDNFFFCVWCFLKENKTFSSCFYWILRNTKSCESLGGLKKSCGKYLLASCVLTVFLQAN